MGREGRGKRWHPGRFGPSGHTMLNLKPFCGYPDDGLKVDSRILINV